MNHYAHWIGAYRKKTAGLTLAEHGAYRLLLDEYYAQDGTLPNEISTLFRVCSAMTRREQLCVEKVASLHFPIGPDGRRHNDKADEEIPLALKRIAIARENGSKGGRPTKEKPGGIPGGLAEKNPAETQRGTQSETSTLYIRQNPSGSAMPDSSNEESSSGKPDTGKPAGFSLNGKSADPKAAQSANTAAMREHARTLLAFLNSKADKRFPETDSNVGILVARLREGFVPQQIRSVIALKCRAWKDDERMREYLRPATLFGREKFSQYVGELVPVPDDDDEPGVTREREEFEP